MKAKKQFKRLIGIICFLILPVTLISDTPPHAFSYQAIIRNTEGELICNQPIRMRISIYLPQLENLLPEVVLYSETHNVQTNENGLITLMIGKGESTDNFAEIIWTGTRERFLKTEIDISNLSRIPNYTIQTSTQLLSVPYALVAAYADSTNYANNSKHSLTADIATALSKEKIYTLGERTYPTMGNTSAIVFWTNQRGNKALACYEFDSYPMTGRTGWKWMNDNYTVYGTRTAFGSGLENTTILAEASQGDERFVPAACFNFFGLIDFGENIWYIPSLQELKILYEQREHIPNLKDEWYWSSSGGVTTVAWAYDFATGNYTLRGWDNSFNVRIITKLGDW